MHAYVRSRYLTTIANGIGGELNHGRLNMVNMGKDDAWFMTECDCR